ncbi:MAG: isocitrate lyase/phosphoenolpyruvate mutase family protein [Pseudomonadota bacterium]
MPTQQQKADKFHALHVKGDPIVLFNIWDPGSAKVVAEAGAHALATGSAPVAMAQNYGDGEQLPLDQALANAARIAAQTDLPLTLDFEGAYSQQPEGITINTLRALETGVIGFNFEDQIVGSDQFYPINEQITRVLAMRTAIEESGINAFLNARTDLFLKSSAEHHADHLNEAIERAEAYESVGASGFFAPGLTDITLIESLCSRVNLPVNIIMLPGCPPKDKLSAAGVARISYGPVPYRSLMASLGEAARSALT